MDYHHHARRTIYSREQLARKVIERRLSLREAAAECGLSRQSAAKWVRSYRELGKAGMSDGHSRPHRSPRRTPAELVAQVEVLRRQRWTGVRIAQTTGLSRASRSGEAAEKRGFGGAKGAGAKARVFTINVCGTTRSRALIRNRF